MHIASLLDPSRIASDLAAGSKKRTLEQMAELLSRGLDSESSPEVFSSLSGRERLGSTAIGHGVAIPHGRVAGLQQAIGAFGRYPAGLDFDAADEEPVRLVFALLVPAESTTEHLQLLAGLAEIFSRPDLRARLLKAASPEELYQILLDQAP
ncbi:PTS sugar transporter subunit IIA [Thermithiobacillus plumbiphilus]|uniref:PTS sugar transporter subunit IIA n=1 Tax=Thermithiobacillus plumbiphilus TaxID=1729899 RepID=A0ABU9DB90_9PROT